jgi:DNA-binding MarR family transcriptional regulator
MTSSSAELNAYLEPTARAVRRGDLKQLRDLATKVRGVYVTNSAREETYELGVVVGYVRAIEGILEAAAERTEADSQHTYLASRKRAVAVLLALAQVRWKKNPSLDPAGEDASYSMTQLSTITGILQQNLPRLITDLVEKQLVIVKPRSQERRAAITDEGLAALELIRPGWHVEVPDCADENREFQAALTTAINRMTRILSAGNYYPRPVTGTYVQQKGIQKLPSRGITITDFSFEKLAFPRIASAAL